MYNIDVNFLSGSVIEDNVNTLNNGKYNRSYKKKLIEGINSRNFKTDECADCTCSEPFVKLQNDEELIEVECRGLISSNFCVVKKDISIQINNGDLVIVSCGDAVDIARVKEISEMVSFRFQKEEENVSRLPNVLRLADKGDLQQFELNRTDEQNAIPIFREKVINYNLSMKLVHVHFQFDRRKLFFYYTSDGRVDFRELARDLASQFKTRIELRQIGVRDEAKMLGGLGTCGREYCCSSFLENFKRITTQIASEQNLSANMAKLSGPCGKLKCCLSYETE